MNQRLAKRHKRQVSRAKERLRFSEPDLRTPEQIKAARDASRPADARNREANVHKPIPSSGGSRAPGTASPPKTDA